MSHNENELKKEEELREVTLLFDHLGITMHEERERPDFTFMYDGKRVGLEHIRCFPTKKTIEHNCWHEIEGLIKNELNKCNLPPRLISYSVKTHDEGKRNYKDIAKEIEDGYRYMLDHGIDSISIGDDHVFQFRRLSYLSFYPNQTLEKFSLGEMTGGVLCENYEDVIAKAIEKKKKLLERYKEEPNNKDIQEYWLSIYIPIREACITQCDMTRITSKYDITSSTFDRIYLINGNNLGYSKILSPSNILQLK